MNNHDEHYEKICKPQFEEIKSDVKEDHEKIHTIHRIVTNGLVTKVNDNHDRIKSLDNRLWTLLFGVGFSILLQILLYVMRSAG